MAKRLSRKEIAFMKDQILKLVNEIMKYKETKVRNFTGNEGYGSRRKSYTYVDGWTPKGVIQRFYEKKSGIRTEDRLANLRAFKEKLDEKQNKLNEIKQLLKETIKENNFNNDNIKNEINKSDILNEVKEYRVSAPEYREIYNDAYNETLNENEADLLRLVQKDVNDLFNGKKEELDLNGFPIEIRQMYLNAVNAHEAADGNKTLVIGFDDDTTMGVNYSKDKSMENFGALIEGKMNDIKPEDRVRTSTNTTDFNKDAGNVTKISLKSLSQADIKTYYKSRNGGFLIYKIKPIEQIIKEFNESKTPKIIFNKNENLLKEYENRPEENKNDDFETYTIKKLLKRYQLSNDLSSDMFKLNCLNYAILQHQKENSGITDELLNKIRCQLKSRQIDSKFLTSIATTYDLCVNVYNYEKDRHTTTFNEAGKININVVQYKNHFFIHEKINEIKISNQYMSSGYFVSKIITDKRFSYQDLLNMPSCLDYAADIELSREEDFYKNMIKHYQTEKEEDDKKEEKKPKLIIYADTEATVCESYEILNKDRKLYQEIKKYNQKRLKGEEYDKEEYKKLMKQKEEYESYEQKAFCISYCKERDYDNMITYYGFDCLIKFMDDMAELSKTYSVYVYFHNLGYDFNMFNKFIYHSCISKGRKIYSGSINYKNQIIRFKDSLAILSMSIKSCANTFCKKLNLHKEMFPYKYYNNQNVNTDCGTFEDIKINEEYKFDLTQFKANCIKIGAKIDDKHFDMKKYCAFYCEQDVRILAMSFDSFRSMALEKLNKDVINYTTIPALAKDLICEAVLNDKDISLVAGELQEFLRKGLYGGRTMTSQNRAWIYFDLIASCDFCSLYPSAMSDLYTIKGDPEIMNKDETEDNNYLNLTCEFKEQPTTEKYISGYVVEIVITKINKFKKFSRATFKTDLGCQYLDKDVRLPRKVVLNNIMLEDIIKAHDIEFYTLQGVKYTGQKDFVSINKFITKLFNTRAELKAKHDDAQIIYKLLLNSSYGKLIQKPIENEIKFVPKYKRLKSNSLTNLFYKKYELKTKEELIELVKRSPDLKQYFTKGYNINDKLPNVKLCEIFNEDELYYNALDAYIIKNEYKIKEINEVSNELYRVDVYKPQLDQFSDPFLGGLILAYSKRLMNQVFEIIEYLEERDKDKLINDMLRHQEKAIKEYGVNPEIFNDGRENNVIAFYQDTDSIYLRYDYLNEINELYKEKYGHELLKANTLLRMHSPDFEADEIDLSTAEDKTKFNDKNILAIKSIFLTKKLYYCHLYESESKAYGHHIKAKGIPKKSLIDKIENDFNNDYFDFYLQLFNGKKYEIDLLKTCANIKQNKNFKITSLNEFSRTMELKNIDYEKLKYEDEKQPKQPIDCLKVQILDDNQLMGPCWFDSNDELINDQYNENLKYCVCVNYGKFQMYKKEYHEIVNNSIIYGVLDWNRFKTIKHVLPSEQVYLISDKQKEEYKQIAEKPFGEILSNPDLFKIICEECYIYYPWTGITYRITGRARQLQFDDTIVIDFDVKNPDDRIKLIDMFKEFKVGKFIKSPNDGLHIELKHDKIFYNDKLKGRFIQSFKNNWFNIDCLFPNCSWSIGVCEGSKILKKDGKTYGTYEVIEEYEDQSFKSFIHKFNKLFKHQRYLVNWNSQKIFKVDSDVVKRDKKRIKKQIKEQTIAKDFNSKLNWEKCGVLKDIKYFTLFDCEIHYSNREVVKDADGFITLCCNGTVCNALSRFTKEAKRQIVEILLTKPKVSESSKKEFRELINKGII